MFFRAGAGAFREVSDVLVSEVMDDEIYAVDVRTSMKCAEEVMEVSGLDWLPVLRNGEIVGTVSRDTIGAAAGSERPGPVESPPSKDRPGGLAWCSCKDPVEKAECEMAATGRNHLLVADENGQLIGSITADHLPGAEIGQSADRPEG